MNRAENHVLEHALGDLLGAQPTDLPEKVLRRLREGTEREGSKPAPPRRTTRIVGLVSAAAASILVAWFLGGQLRRTGTDPTTFVATAEGGLGVLRAGERQQRQLASFELGETLVNGPQRERRVTLSGSGGTITMGRCAMLTLAEDDAGLVIVPRLGRTTLAATGQSALRVRTELGTLVLRAPATLQVDLLAEDYDLEHPERFQQLAEELHMNSARPLVITIATLLAGTATLESPAGTRQLQAGESLQDQEVVVSTEQINARLLEEVGTWNLSVTNIAGDGRRSEPLQGVEVCSAGPGDRWLLTDMSVKQGDREISMHTVIGYDTRGRGYTGSLVDSFGGEIALLKGTPQADLVSRTLRMYSAKSTPGFDARWTMRWETESRRRTEIEMLQGEEWILVREIVHQRQK